MCILPDGHLNIIARAAFMGAGAEEPNALVGVGTDGRIEPNLKATQVELYDGLVAVSQNRSPSLKLDVGEINSVLSRFFPAGFYYKTLYVACQLLDDV